MAASYPTSIKSFTTKVDDVDDVMAVDINGLQDEVVAIETALGAGLVGGVVQVVNVQSGAVATGTTVMPHDDTIPQNTEGDEYMTLAVTPKSATNILKIDVVIVLAHGSSPRQAIGLFQDTTAGAIAAALEDIEGTDQATTVSFTHYMTAGTTSATTFKVRAGSSGAGTTTFNGVGGARKLGGVMASSITITEIKV